MIYNITSKQQIKFMRPEMQFISELGKNLYKNGLYIAGGSIICAFKGLPVNDIDVLSTSPEINMEEAFRKSIPDTWKFTSTPNPFAKFADDYKLDTSEGTSYKVQLIHPKGNSVGEPNIVLKNFDIVNCMVYINEQGTCKCPKGYTLHNTLFSPVLGLNKVSDPVYTYERVLKYIDRGYIINPQQALKELMNIKVAQGLLVALVKNPVQTAKKEHGNIFGDHRGLNIKHMRSNVVESYVEQKLMAINSTEARSIIAEVTSTLAKANIIYSMPEYISKLVNSATVPPVINMDDVSITTKDVDDNWDFLT